ncbi:MAG: CDP-alcohol phosphatidyltransferase family protein, partial [Actinomadura sp.]
MANFTLDDVRQRTYKARDAWWTVLLVDPLASRLVKFTANRTRITPNQLTVGALILGLG